MFKIFLFITTAIVYMFNIVLAQAPAIEWQRTIGGNAVDNCKVIKSTADGGYIVGGDSKSGISGEKTEANLGDGDYWVVKLDPTGQTIEWQNTIGGDLNESMYDIQQTTDGGYILGGHSDSGISGDKSEASQEDARDYWVVKLDPTGQTIEWQNTIGGAGEDNFDAIQQTRDGGYILGGYSDSGISGDKTEASLGLSDYWVVKLDPTGQTIEWQNTIGGAGEEWLSAIHQTRDGGYILGGYSESGISGDKTEASLGKRDYWVVKLDSTGQTIEWQNTIGGNDDDRLFISQQTVDGGYILGGYSESGMSGDKSEAQIGSDDCWVVKLDSTGQTIEWENTIGGNASDRLWALQQTTNGGYILCVQSESGISGDKSEAQIGSDDGWVVRLDNGGNILWDKTIGGADLDKFRSILQTTNGGYILAGASESGMSGDKTGPRLGATDYWVVKLKPDAQLTVEEETGASIPSKFSLSQNYPNPFNPKTKIKFDLPENGMVKLNIYNILGQKVLELVNRELNSGQYNYSFDAGNLPSGVYVYKLETKNYNQTRKMILMK